MSNDMQTLRAYRLARKLMELIENGKRDPVKVAEALERLQLIQDDPDFHVVLCPPSVEPSVAGGNSLGSAKDQLNSWIKFYADHFGIKLDPAEVKIPDAQPGFNRLIVVREVLVGHPNRIVAVLRQHMQIWAYIEDLDKKIVRADYLKRPAGTYALWIRENQEADQDLKNKSAQDLERQNRNCMTLEERLLYEAVYFRETSQHLDVKNTTLCAGSRYCGGNVPYVFWNDIDGELCVNWYDVQDRNDGLRARSAVL